MRVRRYRLLLVVQLAFVFGVLTLPGRAGAAPYPMVVTDMAGRQVTIAMPPQRIALQDGRIALDLAVLERGEPFSHIVVWNNLIRRFSPDFWPVLVARWPAAEKIPDMGFDDNGAVNLEEVIARKPQILIAELRARPVLEQDGTLRTLASLGIPVLFVDNSERPVPDAARSVLLLGKVLNRNARAAEYDDFYEAHLTHLMAAIDKQPRPHPSVFVEALAGQSDAGNCCFTHGDFGWGLLVQAVGARNLGSRLLHTPTGQVSVETLLARQPNILVMTGRSPGGAMPSFGYNTSRESVAQSLERLEARTGLSALHAVQDGRVYGIYHPFYSSAFNIVGLEYLAKFIYPQAFSALDPGQTYATLIARFTTIPATPVLLGLQAPAHG
jgi:iron complex transport system substrate-binding protein